MKPASLCTFPPGWFMHLQHRRRNARFPGFLSPAKSKAPVTVEVSDQEPWKSLRG